MTQRLQVGLDFSRNRAEVCLLRPDGQLLEAQRAFGNSVGGYEQAKQFLLEAMQQHQFDGLDVSGEATGYYWLPFFLHLAADPELAEQDLALFLLNPRWVKWFKKCFAQDDKSDPKDAFYIAERTRTHRPPISWLPPLETLPLRFLTRYRFHLAQSLSREKNYFAALLFLKLSAYYQVKPFSDVFGLTSQLVLTQASHLEAVAALPVEALAEYLAELSQHHLPDPMSNASKLKLVLQQSFPLEASLVEPVQTILTWTLAQIRFLEAHCQQVEAQIIRQLQAHPAIAQLSTIPGVGPIFASGIGAEIGDTHRFLQAPKWDKQQKRYRPRTLRDAEDAVAKIAGLWWPRHSSGEFEAQDRQLAKSGNRYLRYYFIQAADKMRQHIPDYTDFYQRKYREVKKHQHQRALVLTARKSVGLFVGLLHRNEAYRPKEA